MKKDEEWRPVVGWESYYEVSSLGRVRSITRHVERKFFYGMAKRVFLGRVLRQNADSSGRMSVSITGNGKRKTRRVHQMVAEAFLGPRPSGTEVAHNNGDASDNRVENLRYATPKENNGDKLIHGTLRRGEAAPTALLTEDQVRQARSLPKGGAIKAFAQQLGVTPAALYAARSGVTWKHIQAGGQ